MHNTNSNTNLPSNPLGPLEWANRFVPLPPTEFPDEVAIHNSVIKPPEMDPGKPLTQTNNASLPCLQDIAGVDPFFTPMQTPQTPSSNSSNSGTENNVQPVFSPPAMPQHSPAVNVSDTQQAESNAVTPPRVEVIGQQANPAHAETSMVATDDASLKTPPNQNPNHPSGQPVVDSGFEKPNVEIHEYDLAMKVLPNATAGGSPDAAALPEAANQPASTEQDLNNYWSQDNVASFMPGITPIEAYPVCQEYVEQVCASGESESITLSDIQLEQLLATTKNIKSEPASETVDEPETSQPDEDSNAQAESTIQAGVVPVQVDPFETDAFESTFELSLLKTSNQSSQQTQTPPANENLPANIAVPEQAEVSEPAPNETEEQAVSPEFAEAATEVNLAEATSPEQLEISKSEPVVPEVPNLAARQVDTPAATDPDGPTAVATAPQETVESLETAESIPETPNDNQANQGSAQPATNDLFESVEKSLTDLQSFNQYESSVELPSDTGESDSFLAASTPPAEPEASDVQSGTEAFPPSEVTPASEPAEQPEASNPPFVPIDLTASLPSVQAEAKFQQPSGPATSSESITPPMPPAFQSIEQTILRAVQSQQIKQPAEPEVEQHDSAVEAVETEITPSEVDTPEMPASESVEHTNLQAHDQTEQVDKSVEQVIEQTVEHSVEHSVEQTVDQTVDQTVEQTVDQTVEQTVDQTVEQTVEQTVTDAKIEPEPDPDCQVIQVDGNDGYDFIDLKAFNVAHASFCPGKIFLDDGTTKFQIQHRNLTLAVFADDFQVELAQ